jgi:hypothetical protein
MDMTSQHVSEDWLSVWIGPTSVWTDASKALAPVSKAYAGTGGVGALFGTYVALLVVMTAATPRRCSMGKGGPLRACQL